MNALEFSAGGRRWRADLDAVVDLSIPLAFDGVQPRFFTDTAAVAEPLQAEGFSGSVSQGASCNCAVYTLAPHCHGTHTECVGHVTADGAEHSSDPCAIQVRRSKARGSECCPSFTRCGWRQAAQRSRYFTP